MICHNETSIDELIDDNKGLAFTISRIFCKNRGAYIRGMSEEDLRQEIYINWFKWLPKYDPSRAKLSTFLGKIAVTTCLKFTEIRKKDLASEPISTYTKDYTNSSLFVIENDPLEKMIREERSSKLNGVFKELNKHLTPRQQEIVNDLYINKIPYRVISKNRGISKQRISQIKNKVIEKLFIEAGKLGYERVYRS